LCKGVEVYPTAEADTTALAVVEMLQQDYPHAPVVALALYVGQGRLPCRLLADRLPEEVVQQRRSTAYEVARRKGRTPTQSSGGGGTAFLAEREDMGYYEHGKGREESGDHH